MAHSCKKNRAQDLLVLAERLLSEVPYANKDTDSWCLLDHLGEPCGIHSADFGAGPGHLVHQTITDRIAVCISVTPATAMNDHTLRDVDAQDAYINRELSWLAFARRVLEIAEDPAQPLLERVKFAGIMGMILDEFVMKRLGGLHQKNRTKPEKQSYDGLTPCEELALCWEELLRQTRILSDLFDKVLVPALGKEGIHFKTYPFIDKEDQAFLTKYFEDAVLPILTPLAVDAAHPFPFISNLCLNIAIVITQEDDRTRFVRLKVPANRKRWVALPGNRGFVRLEEVIANNLRLLFPKAVAFACYYFRVTRAAKDNPWDRARLDELQTEDMEPGSIIGMVTAELNFRKFAGIVRLEVSEDTPVDLRAWLVEQLDIDVTQTMAIGGMLGYKDLLELKIDGRGDLRDAPHVPKTHRDLQNLHPDDCNAFFNEIKRGDLLIHLPYHDFDTSILRLLQHAASDPKVLAIKLTIYRTATQSPIVKALMEAAQRGKQVAVLVEITARFDEAPNIAWGKILEQAGAHVVYGVEGLKTHVKLAMIVREESDGIKRYIHIGTGNYHTGTAKLYGDLGIISCHEKLGWEVSRLFNELTGAIAAQEYNLLLVAPHNMRDRFVALIREEVINHKAGKPSGIKTKMNQLQDRQIIRELYLASQAGVPISMNIRGLCSLKAGVPGLSETIRVYSIVGRFLEHSRIYRFENGGDPIFLIGSADWMKRNLESRMETIMPVESPKIKAELEDILAVYESDNTFSWDMQPDGSYQRRQPAAGETPLSAQQFFAHRLRPAVIE
ncbi:MAG: polyphosphate kinase 1 [Desulforhopalus sp.]|nr:polyphosphate kinase 1 [Desulforhopalus sp.]